MARRKPSSGAFASGRTPQDRRDDLQLAAAVRAVRQVEIESEASAQTNLYSSYVVAKTRLSSLAQLSRTGLVVRPGLAAQGSAAPPTRAAWRWVPAQHAREADTKTDEVQPPSPDTNSPVDCLCLARSRAAGPTRPARGRGTNAASRCMNSSGDITRCVVPSRQGVLSTRASSESPSLSAM